MADSNLRFELPKNIERYLATLSKLYAREDKRLTQEIIVNAQVRVHEQWTSDNWNGGTYGHALTLTIPETLYLTVIKQKNELQNQICEDLNKIHGIPSEYIHEVFLEVEQVEIGDWRHESGLLLGGKKIVPPDARKRIWGDARFCVFLSHKSEVKKQTATLRDNLRMYGISAFVVHADIFPTKTWQDEIERALSTMDAFVALMTDRFHESDWTDQEVGFAIARGVPIISVRLGKDPYGFIGKYQALTTSWETCAEEIAKVLIGSDRMFEAFLDALRECPNFDDGNKLANVLFTLQSLRPEQIEQLVDVYNSTSELRGCFALNGKKETYYGKGLVRFINRLGSREYRFGSSSKIETIR